MADDVIPKGGFSVRGGNAQRRGGVNLKAMTDTAPTDTAEEIMIVTDAARATVLDIGPTRTTPSSWACSRGHRCQRCRLHLRPLARTGGRGCRR